MTLLIKSNIIDKIAKIGLDIYPFADIIPLYDVVVAELSYRSKHSINE